MLANAKTPPWWRNDAWIFVVLLLITVVGFAITFAVTSSYRHREDALARRSFQAGVSFYKAGRAAEAVSSFQTALLYSHNNPEYRLRLAQALAANNQFEQAAAYYFNLWERQPGNGLYNLELARLLARQNRPNDAARYFHAAIYGVWDKDAALHRFQARTEFIDFLLSRNSPLEAQAEAVALSADTPDTSEARFQTADLLYRTGAFERALGAFASLTSSDSRRAAVGAGASAFALGHYRSAERFLRSARQLGPLDAQAQQWLEQSSAVLEADPNQRRLRSTERARRISDAYRLSGARLQSCATEQNQTLTRSASAPTALEHLYDEWRKAAPKARSRVLTHDPEAQDMILELAFQIEEATARVCGTPSGKDWALLMLSRYGSSVQK